MQQATGLDEYFFVTADTDSLYSTPSSCSPSLTNEFLPAEHDVHHHAAAAAAAAAATAGMGPEYFLELALAGCGVGSDAGAMLMLPEFGVGAHDRAAMSMGGNVPFGNMIPPFMPLDAFAATPMQHQQPHLHHVPPQQLHHNQQQHHLRQHQQQQHQHQHQQPQQPQQHSQHQHPFGQYEQYPQYMPYVQYPQYPTAQPPTPLLAPPSALAGVTRAASPFPRPMCLPMSMLAPTPAGVVGGSGANVGGDLESEAGDSDSDSDDEALGTVAAPAPEPAAAPAPAPALVAEVPVSAAVPAVAPSPAAATNTNARRARPLVARRTNSSSSVASSGTSAATFKPYARSLSSPSIKLLSRDTAALCVAAPPPPTPVSPVAAAGPTSPLPASASASTAPVATTAVSIVTTTPPDTAVAAADRKPKKRHILQDWETQILNRCFEQNQFLQSNKAQELSAQLGMTVNQVRIWFQNKRAYVKRQTAKNESDSSEF